VAQIHLLAGYKGARRSYGLKNLLSRFKGCSAIQNLRASLQTTTCHTGRHDCPCRCHSPNVTTKDKAGSNLITSAFLLFVARWRVHLSGRLPRYSNTAVSTASTYGSGVPGVCCNKQQRCNSSCRRMGRLSRLISTRVASEGRVYTIPPPTLRVVSAQSKRWHVVSTRSVLWPCPSPLYPAICRRNCTLREHSRTHWIHSIRSGRGYDHKGRTLE
jgi:hypothetical protein